MKLYCPVFPVPVNPPNNSEAVLADWHVCKCLLAVTKVYTTRFSIKRKHTVQKINKKKDASTWSEKFRQTQHYSSQLFSTGKLSYLMVSRLPHCKLSQMHSDRKAVIKKKGTLSTITSYHCHNYHLTMFKYVSTAFQYF